MLQQRLVLTITCVALLATAAAASDREPLHPNGRIAPESVVRTWVSGCLDVAVRPQVEADEPCAGIMLTSAGNTVHLRHHRATMNCCTDVAITAAVDGSTLRFHERESGQWCHCLCPYDLEAQIGGVRSGVYTAEVWSSNDELLCRQEMRVGGSQPTAQSSGCLATDGDDRDSVEFTLLGNDLHIDHHAEELNCCLELTVSTQIQETTLRVVEHDRGLPCDCLCPFDLAIVVPDLASGTWNVELLDPNGQLVATSSITVP